MKEMREEEACKKFGKKQLNGRCYLLCCITSPGSRVMQ